MEQPRTVYDEAFEHYQSCNLETSNISDVWQHKLGTKGRVYSLEQLKYALNPGSAVSGDFYDFNYYVDPSVVDLGNAVTARIIESRQSDLGHPLKDLTLCGVTFSSKFISTAALATRIITRLNELKIRTPRIMEIGGGAAFLFQILKRYYQDQVTLFAVDLPETLMIQEWLLRNWFPDAPHTYKGSVAPVTFSEGGINFINAYVLESQDIPMDVVVNTSSIQEMDASTVDGYFAYAAKNLSDGGFFYYANHFGHGNNAAIEPTEHNLPEVFTTVAADIVFQVDANNPAGAEAFQLVLGKTRETENSESRRYIHRLLWNGFNSGLIPRDQALVRELSALPRSTEPNGIGRASGAVLDKFGVSLDRSILDALHTSVHIDPGFFSSSYVERIKVSNGRHLSAQDFMATMWGAQSALIQLMDDVLTAPTQWSIDAAKSAVREICRDLLRAVGNVEDSEFRTANLACFLMPLGEAEAGRKILTGCAHRSEQDYWLVRFAHLLSDYGFNGEAYAALNLIPDLDNISPIFLAKTAEIKHLVGQDGEATTIIRHALKVKDRLSYTELRSLACAGAIIKDLDLATEAFRAMAALPEASEREETLEFVHIALLSLGEQTGAEFASRCLDEVNLNLEHPKTRILTGILRHLIDGSGAGTETIDDALAELPKNYHSLGWAGNVLMRAGFEELADGCLNKSLALMTPANFLHHEFVGNVYFSAGKWLDAAELFSTALEIIPYARNLRAKAAYCRVLEPYREARVFSDPLGLAMILPQTQDFYSDIVPSLKPRTHFVLR